MGGPDFMIVGTPRSGTTLVQRLATELVGVATPPETHFLDRFGEPLISRRRFPLGTNELREELSAFVEFHRERGLVVDADEIIAALGGRARTMAELFGAVVSVVAGPADVVGEKTPEHLLWWSYLTRRLPALKLVLVVRDPRAVVASSLEADFGLRLPELVAQRWQSDQQVLLRAHATLGSERSLVLRYEEVVNDPEAGRAKLASFIGRPTATRPIDPATLFVASEPWKRRVREPVTTARVAAWEHELDRTHADVVARICRNGMRALGYGSGVPRGAARRSLSLHPVTQARRARFLVARRRRLARIDTLST